MLRIQNNTILNSLVILVLLSGTAWVHGAEPTEKPELTEEEKALKNHADAQADLEIALKRLTKALETSTNGWSEDVRKIQATYSKCYALLQKRETEERAKAAEQQNQELYKTIQEKRTQISEMWNDYNQVQSPRLNRQYSHYQRVLSNTQNAFNYLQSAANMIKQADLDITATSAVFRDLAAQLAKTQKEAAEILQNMADLRQSWEIQLTSVKEIVEE